MKKTLLTAAAVFLWCGSALAEPQTVTLPAADYQAIVNQLKALQSRVDALGCIRSLWPKSMRLIIQNIYL